MPPLSCRFLRVEPIGFTHILRRGIVDKVADTGNGPGSDTFEKDPGATIQFENDFPAQAAISQCRNEVDIINQSWYNPRRKPHRKDW